MADELSKSPEQLHMFHCRLGGQEPLQATMHEKSIYRINSSAIGASVTCNLKILGIFLSIYWRPLILACRNSSFPRCDATFPARAAVWKTPDLSGGLGKWKPKGTYIRLLYLYSHHSAFESFHISLFRTHVSILSIIGSLYFCVQVVLGYFCKRHIENVYSMDSTNKHFVRRTDT